MYDVIIVGGSFTGLSAALSLGRSCRQVLVLDAGEPANRRSARSYNFLTHEGDAPSGILGEAIAELSRYETVTIQPGQAVSLEKEGSLFTVKTADGGEVRARRVLLACGLQDILPEIPGLKECWGISVVHCPYCHGYEHRQDKAIVIGNSYESFTLAGLLRCWNKDVALYTHGASGLTELQRSLLERQQIPLEEQPVAALEQQDGEVQYLVMQDGSRVPASRIYINPTYAQSSRLPAAAGCALTHSGMIATDEFGQTSIPGIYAAGDCTGAYRAISVAVGEGTRVSAYLHQELHSEDLQSLNTADTEGIP